MCDVCDLENLEVKQVQLTKHWRHRHALLSQPTSCFYHHRIKPPQHLPGKLDVARDFCAATPRQLILSSVWRLGDIRERGLQACQSCHFDRRHLQFRSTPPWVTHGKTAQSERFAGIRWERRMTGCCPGNRDGFFLAFDGGVCLWFIYVFFSTKSAVWKWTEEIQSLYFYFSKFW